MDSNYNKIYEVVQKIPDGKVSTYGRVARLAGFKSPRTIGRALHLNPCPGKIPCHRVVNSRGCLAKSFAFGGLQGQKSLLLKEGVMIINNKVNLKEHLWEE